MPGTASKTSPCRKIGRWEISTPPTIPALAERIVPMASSFFAVTMTVGMAEAVTARVVLSVWAVAADVAAKAMAQPENADAQKVSFTTRAPKNYDVSINYSYEAGRKCRCRSFEKLF